MSNQAEPKRRGPKLRSLAVVIAEIPPQPEPQVKPTSPPQAQRCGPKLREITMATVAAKPTVGEPTQQGPRLRQIEAKAVYHEQASKPEPLIDPSCDVVKDLSHDALKDLINNPTVPKLPEPTAEEQAWEAVRNWPKYEPVPLGTKRKRGGQLVDFRPTLLLSMANGKEGEKLA